MNATDDMSGVKEIRYTVNGGPEGVISGDNGTFIIHDDGEDILVEYRAIDNAGNIEPKNEFEIDIDQTEPDIELTYEVTGGNWWQGWELTFYAEATDVMSGMERVEFYVDDYLQETVYGAGPVYCWVLHSSYRYNNPFNVRGLIFSQEITEEYVNFYAIMVRISGFQFLTPTPSFYACAFDNAGNYDCDEIFNSLNLVTITPGIYLFQSLTLPNNYEGHIGKFFIWATFSTG